MSTLLAPLPDHDPLKVSEVAAALGVKHRTVLSWLAKGEFPGAFRTPGEGQCQHWRIPRAGVQQVLARMTP